MKAHEPVYTSTSILRVNIIVSLNIAFALILIAYMNAFIEFFGIVAFISVFLVLVLLFLLVYLEQETLYYSSSRYGLLPFVYFLIVVSLILVCAMHF